MIATTRFHEVSVYRERYNIDIIVKIETLGSNKAWIIVIENKINATQREHQLADYKKKIKEIFPDSPTLLIFLTITLHSQHLTKNGSKLTMSSLLEGNNPEQAAEDLWQAVVNVLQTSGFQKARITLDEKLGELARKYE